MKEAMTEDQGCEEEEWWDHWNRSHRTEAFPEESEAAQTGRMGLAEVEALGLQGKRILEVGCGTGWLAGHLVESGNYVGLDLSPAAIEVARERFPKGQFAAADFHLWENEGEKFDAILMIDTIAYFRDQDEALRRAHDLLKLGGVLVLTTVNPFVYSRMSWVGEPGKGQVRKWLSKGELYDLLKRNGFRVEKSRTAFPAGDRGILRWVNSRIVNGGASLLGLKEVMRGFKEACGLGQYRLVVACREDKEGEVNA